MIFKDVVLGGDPVKRIMRKAYKKANKEGFEGKFRDAWKKRNEGLDYLDEEYGEEHPYLDTDEMLRFELEQYQQKGEVKPFVTDNKREYEKRRRAYADSLFANNYYNEYFRLKNQATNSGRIRPWENQQAFEDLLKFTSKYHNFGKYYPDESRLATRTGQFAGWASVDPIVANSYGIPQKDETVYTETFGYPTMKPKRPIQYDEKSDDPLAVWTDGVLIEYAANPKYSPAPVQQVVYQEKPKTYNYEISREVQLPNVTNAQILRQLLFHNNYNLNPVEGVDYTLDKKYKDVNTKITDQDIAAWNKTFGVEPYTKEMTEDEAKEMEKQGYIVKRMQNGGPADARSNERYMYTQSLNRRLQQPEIILGQTANVNLNYGPSYNDVQKNRYVPSFGVSFNKALTQEAKEGEDWNTPEDNWDWAGNAYFSTNRPGVNASLSTSYKNGYHDTFNADAMLGYKIPIRNGNISLGAGIGYLNTDRYNPYEKTMLYPTGNINFTRSFQDGGVTDEPSDEKIYFGGYLDPVIITPEPKHITYEDRLNFYKNFYPGHTYKQDNAAYNLPQFQLRTEPEEPIHRIWANQKPTFISSPKGNEKPVTKNQAKEEASIEKTKKEEENAEKNMALGLSLMTLPIGSATNPVLAPLLNMSGILSYNYGQNLVDKGNDYGKYLQAASYFPLGYNIGKTPLRSITSRKPIKQNNVLALPESSYDGVSYVVKERYQPGLPDIGRPVADWEKRVQNFYEKDVNPRLRKMYTDEILFFDKGETMPPLEVVEPQGKSWWAGFASGADEPVRLRNWEGHFDDAYVHEGAHVGQFQRGKKFGKYSDRQQTDKDTESVLFIKDKGYGYSKKAHDLLDDAYQFTDDFLKEKEGSLSPILEKGASNREMRYYISRQHNDKTGKELDNIIDNISDDELELILNGENVYTRDFLKSINNRVKEGKTTKEEAYKKIREALKGVAYNNTEYNNNTAALGGPIRQFQEGGPTENVPTVDLPTATVTGKPSFLSPGWWNKTADKLDNFALAAGFVPIVGDAASFLADVGANFARYQYDKNDPTLPEWQRKEIAKTNLKSGLGLAGIGALMGLGTIGSLTSKTIQSPFKGFVRKNKSELNWNADDWFSKRYGNYGKPYSVDNPNGYTQYDVESLAAHVPEYEAIEQTAKQNGTWLKMPDGSTWEGDPREWVMMKADANHYNPVNDEFLGSLQYQSAMTTPLAEKFPSGNMFDVWSGTNKDIPQAFSNPNYRPNTQEAENIYKDAVNKTEWIKNLKDEQNKLVKKRYELHGEDLQLDNQIREQIIDIQNRINDAGLQFWREEDGVDYFIRKKIEENPKYRQQFFSSPLSFSVYPTKEGTRIKSSRSNIMRNWDNIDNYASTDFFVDASKSGGNNITFIEGVREGGMDHDLTKSGWNNDLIIHAGTPRVSYLGNNGNLNATRNSNPFIYGSIVPPALLIGTGAAAYNRFNKKDKENQIKFDKGGPISRYGSCR